MTLAKIGKTILKKKPKSGKQIGRASCRERVQIQVVAVSLKKKKEKKKKRSYGTWANMIGRESNTLQKSYSW